MSQLALFDFDKTIISKDSYREFLIFVIKKSHLRTAITTVVCPLLVLLSRNPVTRISAVNILSFLAFWGQKRSLFKLRSDYIRNGIRFNFYEDAVNKIHEHQALGHDVLIISACPHWLLKKIIPLGGINGCFTLGTEHTVRAGSLVTADYCYGENKVTIAKTRGFSLYTWIAGYSDSEEDLPLLRQCRERYIINAEPEVLEECKGVLGRNCHGLTWL